MKHISATFFLCFFFSLSLFAEIILDVNFNNHDEGLYTEAMLDTDWLDPRWNQGIDEGRVSIVSEPSFNEKSLQVLYPELGVGPGMGGAQWPAEFTGYEELFASYYIFFPNGWDGVKGGKLPGLCGAECPTGGENVTGYNGFSARYMFRPGMKVVIYCYHMDKPGEWGEDFELDYTFERDMWYKLTQRIKMNTPEQKDGEVQVWVDDQEALFIDTLRFRAIDTIKIDQFYFSTFYGGSSPDWAPLSDQYIYYDDFKIYTDANQIKQKVKKKDLLYNEITIRQSKSGEIQLHIPNTKEISCQIFDLQGRRMNSPLLRNVNSSIYSVRQLSDGIYILRVKTSNSATQKRFAVIR